MGNVFRGFVKPETKRIKVFGDEWIEVKKRLTVGEQREVGKLLMEYRDGFLVPNLEFTGGFGDVYAYLVDWSLTDNGKPVAITESAAQKLAAIRSLDPDDYKVIAEAVDQHIDAMKAERDAEKNGLDGVSGSSATSPSPSACTGDLSGSES